MPMSSAAGPPAVDDNRDLLAQCCARVAALEIGFAALANQPVADRPAMVHLFDQLADALVDDYRVRGIAAPQVAIVRASLDDVRGLLE